MIASGSRRDLKRKAVEYFAFSRLLVRDNKMRRLVCITAVPDGGADCGKNSEAGAVPVSDQTPEAQEKLPEKDSQIGGESAPSEEGYVSEPKNSLAESSYDEIRKALGFTEDGGRLCLENAVFKEEMLNILR